MPIRDLKSKVERLENLLNVKVDAPAPWAIEIVRLSMEVFTPRPHTEEDIDRQALELTQKYGTREGYDKAFLEGYRNFDHVGFRVQFMSLSYFRKRDGQCDICEAVLTDKDEDADFCQGCHKKYPEKIEEILKSRN